MRHAAHLRSRMALSFLTAYALFCCLGGLLAANKTHLPRMTFTDKETAVKRLPIRGHDAPVAIILKGEPDTVIAAGKKHLTSFNFNQETPEEISISWRKCRGSQQSVKDCSYNITVVYKRKKADLVFLCGTDDHHTECCDVDLSEKQPRCILSKNIGNITASIQDFVVREGEPSVLAVSPTSIAARTDTETGVSMKESQDSELYMTYSGSQDNVGIHKFGRNRVVPAQHYKEQHYVGLVLSTWKEPMQSKAYAFYKEKNSETGLNSEMWLPFVTRVCMNDLGGPKNNLQYSWTSQLSARLFCGDTESRQYFSELVDVAAVHADRWQDTTIYALFRNEWGMSAVCVYTIQDIEHIFTTSPFKGTERQKGRSRGCVEDSTKIPSDILMMIKKNSEMEQWVKPVNNPRPLLINHHIYTHIYVDHSHNNGDNHPAVLFLSLNNGGIHKVMHNESTTFVIAEYRPFNHSTHVASMVLNPISRKLYVSSRDELVQVDMVNCAHYGDSCELCVLARDPYCSWNGTHCTRETRDTTQDVIKGDHSICASPSKVQLPGKDEAKGSITLEPQSKYYLGCPVSSHHALYSWRHFESNISCSLKEQQCLLLIDSMGPEQEGTYTCVSEEMGYSRVMAQYRLQLKSSAAGRSWSPLLWICLMAVLIKEFCPK